MAFINKQGWPQRNFPFEGLAGLCPQCGATLRPSSNEVVVGGSWPTRGENGMTVTGGHLFSFKCPHCEESLLSGAPGFPPWHDVDPSKVTWFPQDPYVPPEHQTNPPA